MKYLPITLNGETVELHGDKFIWIPAIRLLCVSDIHFEKGSYFRRFATLLPPYDSHETLLGLEEAIAQFQPDIFIALGDSFHDVHAGGRLSPELVQRLTRLIRSVGKWVWITGNHDAEILGLIEGERHEEIHYRGLHFRHEALGGGTEAEISGHYHPKVRLSLKGTRIYSPCFVLTENKLIVPAFGSFTGGLNIDDPAFLSIAPAGKRSVFLTYEGRVFSL